MSTKHTPGPWKRGIFGGAPNMDIRADCNGVLVARICGPSERCRGKEWREENAFCEANANLVAAAPDLLKLAKDFADNCFECGGRGEVSCSHGLDEFEYKACPSCAYIRAVIAKAEGRATGEQP